MARTLEEKRKAQKVWADKNREAVRARQRLWAKNNPRPKDRLKPWRLAKFEAKATRKKPTICEACRTPEEVTGRTLCFDHDHATGKFRGWLCFNCNLVLGHAKDSRDRLQLLINYLDKYELLA